MAMRKRISLYIASQLVDLDDQSFILYNYSMEDLTNPTIIRNSFSQQIRLKGSPTNNRIFGDAFRLDRHTLHGVKYLGAYYDYSRRTPFTIYNEMNEVLESGYAKLDKIVRDGVSVEYHVSLYGGLGEFFYNLSESDDGTKKTLADMRYLTANGTYTKIPGHFGQAGGYVMLRDAWAYLQSPEDYEAEAYDNWWPNIINFAPCYNGLPDKFSADKAMVDNKSFENVPYTKIGEDNKTSYSFKEGTSSNLMLFTNPHTEWEVKDLRWYLQRPVFRIKALFDAIADKENNGGYDVVLSSSFFNKNNTLYWDAWITLPLIPAEDRMNPEAVVKLLSSTKTPVDYIISFAKIFGLVFLYDRGAKKVTIMTRSEWYADKSLIDLTKRINKKDLTITPVLAQSQYYQYGGDAIGEWATSYKADFGRDYAIQLVNTGNEFNPETKKVTEGIVFKDAVEVQERNLLFRTNLDRLGSTTRSEIFILSNYESVKIQLWGKPTGSEQEEMHEWDIPASPYEYFLFFDNPEYPLSDWLPKVQFHSEGNKAVDGSDVLLVFNGIKETTSWESWARLEYRLTDDTQDMMVLNSDTPCWNFSQENSAILQSLPSFRRCHTNGEDIIDATYEWGEPRARGVNGVTHASVAQTIYNKWWKAYQQDRYDDDTFKITCKVDLRGFKVGQDLLRRFFYYDGAVFVINKIVNHSLTTWDDTECELIKVQDYNNYR